MSALTWPTAHALTGRLNRASSLLTGPPLPCFRMRARTGPRAWSRILRGAAGSGACRAPFSPPREAPTGGASHHLANCAHTLRSPPRRCTLPYTSDHLHQTPRDALPVHGRSDVLALCSHVLRSCTTALADVQAHTGRAAFAALLPRRPRTIFMHRANGSPGRTCQRRTEPFAS